jgi:UDP-N-acetylglucosamine 2-epimerase (non-hydrolysing)
MSRVFFEELELPKPDIYLGVGSGSHAEQTAFIMLAFEKVLLEHRPDIVIVVGDVNSTLACSVTAIKLRVRVAHVEAGLRSYDRQMPEEINRIVTDALSDYLFTTSRQADENLIKEGIAPEKIFFVGNVMIDTLNKHLARAELLGTPGRFGLLSGQYALMTLHRAANVDDPVILSRLVDVLCELQTEIPLLFPVHPRTSKRLAEFGLLERLETAPQLQIVPPQGYLPFLDLMVHARLVLTDSGGIQEETTILGIPCLTLRQNTERPITVTDGTNTVVGTDPSVILSAARRILSGTHKSGQIPELWDGHAAERLVDILVKHN